MTRAMAFCLFALLGACASEEGSSEPTPCELAQRDVNAEADSLGIPRETACATTRTGAFEEACERVRQCAPEGG